MILSCRLAEAHSRYVVSRGVGLGEPPAKAHNGHLLTGLERLTS